MLILAAILCASAREIATAQTYWRVPAGLGGALVGAGAGWVLDIARWGATSSDQFAGPSLIMTPIGIGVGGLAGFAAGKAADGRLARGDTLSRGARAAMRTVTFLAPVAVGSAATFVIVNPSDEGLCVPDANSYNGCRYEPAPRKMSDEMVALLGIGGGAFLGFVLQHRYAHALWPRARVGLTSDARGISLSMPAGW